MVDYLNLRKITERHIDEIREAVNRVIDSGWYLKGEAMHRFEEDYAQYMKLCRKSRLIMMTAWLLTGTGAATAIVSDAETDLTR